MAPFRHFETKQNLFIDVDLSKQIIPGTFAHTLCYLVDHCLDLSVLNERYSHDTGGSPAYPPSVMLKIILLAYSKGIFKSRGMENACRENILFIAATGEAKPDHSTIAKFISTIDEIIMDIFSDILLICNQMALIGGEIFAVDGCKISSNASKEWSGNKKELENKKKKLAAKIKRLIKKHRESDLKDSDEEKGSRKKIDTDGNCRTGFCQYNI